MGVGRNRIQSDIRQRIEAMVQPMSEHPVSTVDFASPQVGFSSVSARAWCVLIGVCVCVGLVWYGFFFLPGADDEQTQTHITGLHAPSASGLAASMEDTTKDRVRSSYTHQDSDAKEKAKSQDIVVSIQGLVHKPGLVTVKEGIRVGELLDHVGGVLAEANLDGLNLAEKIFDGTQIVIARHDSHILYSGHAGRSTGDAHKGVKHSININTASVSDLQGLPGVGPSTAQAIVAWRQTHGRFKTIEQLLEVRGIGRAKFDALKHEVVVS